jgi:multidrug efflux pump
MGVAIIGGLLVGTVLTLYVVPAMYSYVSSKQERSELAWDVEIPAASEVA